MHANSITEPPPERPLGGAAACIAGGGVGAGQPPQIMRVVHPSSPHQREKDHFFSS
jgi:hypothetical protein